MHQFSKDFCVCVWLEFVSLLGQKLLDVIVVGNNAVVHHHEAVSLVRALRMRVALAGHTVGGPTRVCDAYVGKHWVAVLAPAEVCVCSEENQID